MRKLYGEPSLITIRKTFSNSRDARKWETRVLTRLNAAKNPLFLNKTNIPGPPPEKTIIQVEKIAAKLRGQTRTTEQRHNISVGRLNGKKAGPKTESTKKKMSEAMKGIQKPAGFGAAVSARMKGRVQSADEREKRKATLTGKKKSPEHVAAVVAAKKKKREDKKAANAAPNVDRMKGFVG